MRTIYYIFSFPYTEFHISVLLTFLCEYGSQDYDKHISDHWSKIFHVCPQTLVNLISQERYELHTYNLECRSAYYRNGHTDHFGPIRLTVRLCIRLSVNQTISCWYAIFRTVKSRNLKFEIKVIFRLNSIHVCIPKIILGI